MTDSFSISAINSPPIIAPHDNHLKRLLRKRFHKGARSSKPLTILIGVSPRKIVSRPIYVSSLCMHSDLSLGLINVRAERCIVLAAATPCSRLRDAVCKQAMEGFGNRWLSVSFAPPNRSLG